MVSDATYPAILPMRNQIRREIESTEPFDAQESGHRDDALAWIDSASALDPAASAGPPRALFKNPVRRCWLPQQAILATLQEQKAPWY